MKFAVIKRRWSDDDTDQLDEAIRAEFRRACEENQKASQKIARLPPGAWKNDRLEQLRRWQTIPSLSYATFSIDDDIQVLHWTPEPLDMEIQVAIRFSFPLAAPDQSTFVDICKSLGPHFNSSYEWTDGVLLTTEPIRLHVERVSQSEIELAARVCVDELEEEQTSAPAKLLWPYLAVALRNTLKHLEEHEYLQYTIELIPYGTCFFSPPLQARVFDFSLFMGTAANYDKVAFRHREQLHNVELKKLLPDVPYKSLSQLLELEPPRPKRTQPNSIDEMPVLRNNGDVRPNPAGLTVSHNKGRRVSFGEYGIHSEASKVLDSSTTQLVGTERLDEYKP
ncbi:unnamed protein product [Heligmosomoides polygyrus]|uniref:Uncharacterized protein n=1 Tax=Heligmosomoides polygyrus TaxID=6339 RepID=A0A3P8FIV9_HELPZ|nr:unnamed protein product [Heligmosomoides polygyrus]